MNAILDFLRGEGGYLVAAATIAAAFVGGILWIVADEVVNHDKIYAKYYEWMDRKINEVVYGAKNVVVLR